ncbi:MAG: DNA gyrase/topoisomerase IV subunit A [Bacteroidaceae bacterium]|nr:DNA gyrase/topoisomerase IV subunit A [Bacteroidaceae bacterium]
MSEEIIDNNQENEQITPEESAEGQLIQRDGQPPRSDYDPKRMKDSITHHLSGMYQNWFLEYASYVILERAVPHIMDGLKPVQRRILHSMKRMDDGKLNKVANIVGHTMQFHPHGDASIKDALVQMGQKNLLIDCQGNWGNILTGDDAAAARYIEARLSKFALDVVFNPKTTEWKLSYDGRNKEPISLPVKFPLLLSQGAEGIAVGLSCKILPHNFNEICDAAVSYLHEEEFHLYPDFPTGGSIDVSKYNDGMRGGVVRVRAKIEKRDNKTLAITELPFGKTTGSPQHPSQFIDSILKAAEKGKIKVKKVEDMTSAGVEILLHLMPGTSSDKTIDALYAFTDCEISISPNCCVIDDRKPQFLTVSDVLRRSVDNTKHLIKMELEIRKNELLDQLHFLSLEKIFIEERIYKGKEFENAKNMDAACEYVDERLTPFYHLFVREVTKDDILRLMEIKMARILKFNKDKADEMLARIKAEIEDIDRDLNNLVEVTAQWFLFLKKKYGEDHPRLTEIRSFDTIVASKVAEANQKLYINRADGFIGTSLKKDEFVCNCSDIDDIILFYRDGTYKIIKAADKVFVGETEKSKREKRKAEIIHVAVFKKGDKRTIFNVCYKDGASGVTYIKRFNVTSLTRDREYDVTMGTPKSRITYLTANYNGEAEIIKVTLKPKEKLKRLVFEKDFSEIAIKGRASRGNQLTKHDVYRIQLKSHGGSTLGGRKVWFDQDVQRINYDEQGIFLGEFHNDDRILVVMKNGDFYLTDFDINNHYEKDMLVIEKFNPDKVWTAVLFDADNDNYPYIKRFVMEATNKVQNFLGNPESKLLLLSDIPYPRLELTFLEPDTFRGPLEIDAEEFIAVKGFKAKGKRLTTYALDQVTELEPTRFPEPEEDDNPDDGEEGDDDEVDDVDGNDTETDDENNNDPDDKSDDEIRDELTGQLRLF